MGIMTSSDYSERKEKVWSRDT